MRLRVVTWFNAGVPWGTALGQLVVKSTEARVLLMVMALVALGNVMLLTTHREG